MSNSSIVISDNCTNNSLKDFINLYIMNTINIFGIIANFICIIIFTKIIKTTQSTGNMYKYFLMKSIMDLLSLFINSFEYFKHCSNCEATNSYLLQIWFIWFYMYLSNVAEIASVIFEIAAIFDCFITIKSILNFCQTNLFFHLFSITLIVINVIINLMFPLGYQIESKIENNETSYRSDKNEFGKASFSSLNFFNSLIKDVIFFIILFILNLMILTLLKRTTDRRRALAKNNNNLLSTSESAERRKLIMITATSLNYMFGHFPSLIWSFHLILAKGVDNCYFIYLLLFYYISIADSIFFYFFFNNIFKKNLIESIPFINRNRNTA
jgi:hypothetical protein